MSEVRVFRGNAVATGVLYVLATVAGVASAVVGGGLPIGSGISAELAGSEAQVIGTAGLMLLMAITVSAVAFMLYPVLMRDADTKFKEGLGVWYLGSRIIEGALFLVAILGLFALLELSREFVATGVGTASGFAAAGTVLGTAYDWAWVLGQSAFAVGAVPLYYLLFKSGRVPRWLSVWGLVAAPLMLVAGFTLAFTGDPNSTISTLLYAPLALQEMVLAFWLIFRGFREVGDPVVN